MLDRVCANTCNYNKNLGTYMLLPLLLSSSLLLLLLLPNASVCRSKPTTVCIRDNKHGFDFVTNLKLKSKNTEYISLNVAG